MKFRLALGVLLPVTLASCIRDRLLLHVVFPLLLQLLPRWRAPAMRLLWLLLLLLLMDVAVLTEVVMEG